MVTKRKSNQGFSTLDFVTTVTALVTMTLVTTPIVLRKITTANIEMAQKETARMASELNASPRDIASGSGVGGQSDPWGNPYVLRKVNNSYGLPSFVVILSKGPNAQLDTTDETIGLIRSSNFIFTGDDIGVIRAIE